MANRKKVIRGLEAHANPKTCETCAGEDCPYYNIGGGHTEVTCSSYLAADALALLKEQEARVMTREEVIHSEDWIWYELKNTYHGWTIAVDCDEKWIEWVDFTTDQLCKYGKKWRCWTSRPTPEQMRDTPWEGEKDDSN